MSTTKQAARRLRNSSPWAAERPTREALRREKRDAVLRAAALCFASKGFEATTMDDVAGVLGVAKPTVYRQFRDKAALISACQERAAALFLGVLKEARGRGGSSFDQIRHYFSHHLLLMQNNEYGRMLRGVDQPDLYSDSSRPARKLREEVEEGIREVLREGVQRGEFDAALDPKLVALALAATFNFVGRWYDARGTYTLDEIANQYLKLFLNGIRAP